MSTCLVRISNLEESYYKILNYITYKGGQDGSDADHDQILKFDAERKMWKRVGRMQAKRSYHAVSVVNVDIYCPSIGK